MRYSKFIQYSWSIWFLLSADAFVMDFDTKLTAEIASYPTIDLDLVKRRQIVSRDFCIYENANNCQNDGSNH